MRSLGFKVFASGVGRDRNAFAHVQVSGAGGGGKDSSVTQGEGLITKAGNAIITIASKTDVQKTLRGVGISEGCARKAKRAN